MRLYLDDDSAGRLLIQLLRHAGHDVSTRLPLLRQWAELTIRRQQAARESLRRQGVPAAEVLQGYEPGGSLIIEDAGPLASEALRQNPALKPAYDAYFRDAARGLGWPRLGRIPFVRRLFHDLKSPNIGYTPERGFLAFDPAIDPVTLGVASLGALGITAGGVQLKHLLSGSQSTNTGGNK